MTDNILTRLQNGETVEEIIAEFTNTLNTAIKAQKEMETEADKVTEWTALVDAFIAFFEKYYPEVVKDVDFANIDYKATLRELDKEVRAVANAVEIVKDMTTNKVVTSDDQIIKSFLKDLY